MNKDVFKGIIVCIVLFLGAIWMANGHDLFKLLRNSEAENEPSRFGEVVKDLGRQSWGFGSQNQARELLALIDGNPGKAKYQISYQADVDIVIFGCDLNKQALIRLHQKRNGHGSHETWKGYIMERLATGAAGGSLNDTPIGKMPGSFDSF